MHCFPRALLPAIALLLLSLASAPASLPTGWADADIGSPHNAGSATYDTPTGTFTVTGSGSEIYGTSDQFNYTYQSFTGNFTFVARITGNSGTDVNYGAADGIMVRESLAADSREEEVFVQPGGPHLFTQTRQSDGGSTSRVGAAAAAYPTWLKMERYGDQIALYYSLDGVTWFAAPSQTLYNLSATLYVGLAVTARNSAADAINTVTFDTVSLGALNLTTQTSWLGNTYATPNQFVQFRGEALAVNPVTGNLFVNGVSESYSTTFYDTNGNFTAIAANSHFNGSSAIAWDSANHYVWVALAAFALDSAGNPSSSTGGIAYYTTDGTYQGAMLNVPGTSGQTILGLAVAGGNLYAVDSVDANNATDTTNVTVHIINPGTQTETGNFLVPAGAQNLAADASGNLWIVFNPAAGTPVVKQYSTAGNYLGKQITGLGNPQQIAIDPAGNIYVADSGPNQQVQVYDAGGIFLRSFGALYGIYSTSNSTLVGQTDPSKLDHPQGLAIDNAGNLYVTCNGPKGTWGGGGSGLVMRKYTSTTTASASTLAWERDGLEYVDCAAADPTSDGVDVYTKFHHYVMDYSQPQGMGWTYHGMLCDDFAYPGDPRLNQIECDGSWVRIINGKKYLVVDEGGGQYINFFRFQPNSEVTVPYATFLRETDRYGGANNHLSIWIDQTPYNGTVDAGETDLAGAALGNAGGDLFTWDVDANGDVWSMGGQNNPGGSAQIWHFKMTLNSSGDPTWSSSNTEAFAVPAEFTGPNALVLRVFYIPSTDTMYVGGYTSANPKPSGVDFGYVGTELIRYNNWHTSPTIAYRIVLPAVTTTDGTRAADIAGNLIATVMYASHQVNLYDLTTGAPVDQFLPGPEVGGSSGNLDFTSALNLYQRADGEYLIFTEEDGDQKCLMYRWTAPVVVPPVNSSGTLAFSAATASVDEDAGSVSVSVSRTGGSSGPVSVSYATADGTAVAGTDYTSASGILSWADGESSAKTFTVPIIDRALTDGSTRTLAATISAATGGATVGSPAATALSSTLR